MTEKALVPRQVTITSEAKFFSLDRGASDCSGLSITYDVPEGISRRGLEQMIWAEKERLDLMVLVSERVKESVDAESFKKRVERIKSEYGKLRERLTAPAMETQPAPQMEGAEDESE